MRHAFRRAALPLVATAVLITSACSGSGGGSSSSANDASGKAPVTTPATTTPVSPSTSAAPDFKSGIIATDCTQLNSSAGDATITSSDRQILKLDNSGTVLGSVSFPVMESSTSLGNIVRCSTGVYDEPLRQQFSPTFTQMTATQTVEGVDHVGFVTEDGQFHDLSGAKAGSYATIESQTDPVFNQKTGRVWYKQYVDGTEHVFSVDTDGTGRKQEKTGEEFPDTAFYFDGLNRPLRIDSKSITFSSDGTLSASPGEFGPVKAMKKYDVKQEDCYDVIAIANAGTFYCTTDTEINRYDVNGGKLKLTRLLIKSDNTIGSAVMTPDKSMIMFVGSTAEGTNLYTIPTDADQSEPQLIKRNLSDNFRLLTAR